MAKKPTSSSEAVPAVIDETAATALLKAGRGRSDSWLDVEKFDHIWRIGQAFAQSALVPDNLRGKPADCFILTQLALALRVDPFQMMQNTYVVHGRPGMEAKMQIALLNGSGCIIGQIEYVFGGDGDEYGCHAKVIDAQTRKEIHGPKVTWRVVKAEGWDKPKGSQISKWRTMPDLMFRYRAAAFLIRAHYPEVTMGLQSREELEDTFDVQSRPAIAKERPSGDVTDLFAGAEVEPAGPRPGAKPEKTTKPAKPEKPTRTHGELCRDITIYLEENGPHGLTELAERLGSEQELVHVALADLVEAAMIMADGDGDDALYSIDEETPDGVEAESTDGADEEAPKLDPLGTDQGLSDSDEPETDMLDVVGPFLDEFGKATTITEIRDVRKRALASTEIKDDPAARDIVRKGFREAEARIRGTSDGDTI